MLQIYNTLTRQKEDFQPIEEGKVRMYVCGMTVYDYCHLGHARAMITFDMIYRYLKYLGYDVTFVRNFTDIDDKIIQRSNERKIDYKALSEEFIKAYHEDSQALGTQTPDVEPKATEHIQEMIDIIKGLEDKGLAYQAGNDVFFSVRKFEDYGKLSGKNIEELESGARIDVMETKKDPLDFVLWKGAKPGEPKWPSPWGEGRPGWHIECSAMSMKYLGQTFDIHGGGRDLVFPHHENEIAQSEGCTGKHFANYWIHNGFVNINAEKMSKSLGNFLTIRELLKTFPAEVLRMFLLSAHYRSPIDYTESNMQNAVASLERYYVTKQRLEEFYKNEAKESDGECDETLLNQIQKLKTGFEEAMNDDFNTAKVIGSIFEVVREWNKALDEKKVISKKCIEDYFSAMKNIHTVFGIFGSEAEEFLNELNLKGLKSKDIDPQEVEDLIVKRREARQNKDFKLADQIRDDLLSKGVQLKDNPDGTTSWTLA